MIDAVTATRAADPPPGWYPDPDDGDSRRWWDGERWTHHRAALVRESTPGESDGVVDEQSSASPAQRPPAAPPAGWYPDPDDPQVLMRWWDGAMWTAYREPLSGPPETSPDTSPWEPSRGNDPGLASPLLRLGAALVDAAVPAVLMAVAFAVVAPMRVLVGPGLGWALLVPAVLAVVGLSWINVLMGEGRLGQSYGKHLLGIEVVGRTSGRAIGAGPAFGRALVRYLGAYVVGLGLLWLLWDPERQGWHDKAVSSVVRVARPSRRLAPGEFVRALFRVM